MTQSSNSQIQPSTLGSNPTHLDLMMLVYCYLYSNKNKDLKPAVIVAGRILRKISDILDSNRLSKLRTTLIELDFTRVVNPESTMNVRELTAKGRERLSELGFLKPGGEGLEQYGKVLLEAIHEYANQVREDLDPSFTCNAKPKFRILTKDEAIAVRRVGSKANDVARFTAPEVLAKRTAPENRKRGGILRTRHHQHFVEAVRKGRDELGMNQQDVTELALKEFFEKRGIDLDI